MCPGGVANYSCNAGGLNAFKVSRYLFRFFRIKFSEWIISDRDFYFELNLKIEFCLENDDCIELSAEHRGLIPYSVREMDQTQGFIL